MILLSSTYLNDKSYPLIYVTGCEYGDIMGCYGICYNNCILSVTIVYQNEYEAISHVYLRSVRKYAIYRKGHQKVGKTNIINRIVRDEFLQGYKHTLQNLHTMVLQIDSKLFEIKLHDTGGHQRIVDITGMKDLWRQGKDGYIFIFAIDCVYSLKQVIQDIEQIQSSSQHRAVPIVLVGNKKDLIFQRKLEHKAIAKLANKYNVKYFEISAKESRKYEIMNILYQLIDINQMNQFYNYTTNSKIDDAEHLSSLTGKDKDKEGEKDNVSRFGSTRNSLVNWSPCQNSACSVM